MERDLLTTVMARERLRLITFVRAIVRDHHAAEDVLQEVLAEAAGDPRRFTDEQHLVGWLVRAARHRAIDRLRKQRRDPLVFGDHLLDQLTETWAAAPWHVDRMDALKACMESLSPHARELIALRYQQGLSSGALADRLSRKRNTIYVALSRIHRTLAECVRERLAETADA